MSNSCTNSTPLSRIEGGRISSGIRARPFGVPRGAKATPSGAPPSGRLHNPETKAERRKRSQAKKSNIKDRESFSRTRPSGNLRTVGIATLAHNRPTVELSSGEEKAKKWRTPTLGSIKIGVLGYSSVGSFHLR